MKKDNTDNPKGVYNIVVQPGAASKNNRNGSVNNDNQAGTVNNNVRPIIQTDGKNEGEKDVNKGTKDNKGVTVHGGLQIARNDALEERHSKYKVGGITDALLEVPPGISQKLTPVKVIREDEPVYPTQSRITRIEENRILKNSWKKRLNCKLAKFDLWAIQTIPPAYILAYNIVITLAPILLFLTIWDILGITVFYIPDYTTFNRPGVLYPFYPIGTVAALYGYMMRFLMEDTSRATTVCFIGVLLYPALLIIRCVAHYLFNGYRAETKLCQPLTVFTDSKKFKQKLRQTNALKKPIRQRKLLKL